MHYISKKPSNSGRCGKHLLLRGNEISWLSTEGVNTHGEHHIFLVGTSQRRPPTWYEMSKREPAMFREDLTGHDHHPGKFYNNEHKEAYM